MSHKIDPNGRGDRYCTCGEIFASTMDLNEHINKHEGTEKETNPKVERVELFSDYLD